MSKKLISDFDVPNSLQQIYSLPHAVANETYIWSFQYKPLNYILYTNTKLYKIGLVLSDKCTFCDSVKADYTTFALNAHMRNLFGKKVTSWWFDLGKENINVTLKEIILGLSNRTDITNYLLILGKLYTENVESSPISLCF